MTETAHFSLHIHHALSDIGEEDWNTCLDATLSQRKRNPFLSYAFLKALEDSGCVSEQTGWLPHHMSVRDQDDTCLAVAPLYLKSHSQGEYVFDHAWADALHRAGGDYYPKLQSAIPFTPVTAAKILCKDKAIKPVATQAIAQGLKQLCHKYPISSAHLTFLPQEEASELAKSDFLQRKDQQFHWVNQDYESFDDFLSELSSRKRKNIRKERKTAQSHGLTFIAKRGDEISEQEWDAFFACYMDTGARKWGRPYLNRRFFQMLGERMAKDCLLFLAYEGDTAIAAALNFIGGDTLYGRYWGCLKPYPCLHFELCYHQAIDWAIEHGLSYVEAGAQGEHKLARGYLPQTTYSAHWIDHPAFRQVIADYLEGERQAVDEDKDFLTALSPFRNND